MKYYALIISFLVLSVPALAEERDFDVTTSIAWTGTHDGPSYIPSKQEKFNRETAEILERIATLLKEQNGKQVVSPEEGVFDTKVTVDYCKYVSPGMASWRDIQKCQELGYLTDITYEGWQKAWYMVEDGPIQKSNE